MTEIEKFGIWVKYKRLKKGLTQQALSENMKKKFGDTVSRRTIMKIERNQTNPSERTEEILKCYLDNKKYNNIKIPKNFPFKLKRFRRKNKFSYYDVSKMMTERGTDISHTGIRRWETKESIPTKSNYLAIKSILKEYGEEL